jgi:hypothetical protein
MPTGDNPSSARADPEGVIQLKRFHCRPPSCSDASNFQTIRAPGKMLPPLLLAGMEEMDNLACFGIGRNGQSALSGVTSLTCEPQILDF